MAEGLGDLGEDGLNDVWRGLGSSFLVENDVLMKSVMLTQNISIYLKYSKMPPSTGGCSRYFFIPNGHEIPNPASEEPSGPRSGPDPSSN